MILEVQIQIFEARRRVSFHFQKIPGGPNINIFWRKLAWSLLLHLRKKAEIQIWNLTLKKYHFGPPKKCIFSFWRKPPQKIFPSCFGFDSALNIIDAQMFFWSVFLKTQKKVIDRQKRHFGCFWQLITVFCAFSKILIKVTIFFFLLFYKLELKKKNWKNWLTTKKRAFLSFEIKTIKIFLHIFFCFSFKINRRTNVILISIFKNAKKNVINCQKRPKWRFWRSRTFFLWVFKD